MLLKAALLLAQATAALRALHVPAPPPLALWQKLLPLALIFFCATFNHTLLVNLKVSCASMLLFMQAPRSRYCFPAPVWTNYGSRVLFRAFFALPLYIMPRGWTNLNVIIMMR
jgi:hypothetical protein